MSQRLSVLSLIAVCLGLVTPARGVSGAGGWRASVYGEDDRQDLHQVQDERILGWAAATAALFMESDIRADSPGWVELAARPHGEKDGLCPGERFFDQPAGAFGSGVLVASHLLLTAGHLITQESCPRTRFVFGFGLREAGARAGRVRASDVYRCAEVVDRRYAPPFSDSALVRLDRAAAGSIPLKPNRSGELAQGSALVMIGHPGGLPAKVVAGRALMVFPRQVFFADLDSWGRNSGSPVINARTGLLEGILIRGGPDYEEQAQGCRRPSLCESRECLAVVLSAAEAAPWEPIGY